jgi:hypothetical protein
MKCALVRQRAQTCMARVWACTGNAEQGLLACEQLLLSAVASSSGRVTQPG